MKTCDRAREEQLHVGQCLDIRRRWRVAIVLALIVVVEATTDNVKCRMLNASRHEDADQVERVAAKERKQSYGERENECLVEAVPSR